jgi:hypothetical protein
LLCAFYAVIAVILTIEVQAPDTAVLGAILGFMALALFYKASRV